MKILVVAPQPFFSPRGTPFSVYYRTLVLAEQGASIDLLTYGQGEDVDLPSTRIHRIPDIRLLGHIPVGPSWKKLFLDLFMIAWTIGLLIRHRHEVVHAHEESVFWCRVLKPLFRFKLIYDMHSSLPQQLTNFRFTKSGWLIRVFKWLEDGALRGSDVVITICPDLQDYALATGVDPQRHLLIENSIFDDVRIRKDAVVRAEPARAVDIPLAASGPLIFYAGTFEPYQGIDIVVRAFAIVRQTRSDARLLLLGGTTTQISETKALAGELQLGDSVIFGGRVTKGDAIRLSSLASILVSPRRYGTNTPLKIYEQLASGKPLVATRIWSHTQVLTDEVCVLVEPEPVAMANGLLRLLSEPAYAAELAANAQALYLQKYSRPVYVQKIQRLVSLISSG